MVVGRFGSFICRYLWLHALYLETKLLIAHDKDIGQTLTAYLAFKEYLSYGQVSSSLVSHAGTDDIEVDTMIEQGKVCKFIGNATCIATVEGKENVLCIALDLIKPLS